MATTTILWWQVLCGVSLFNLCGWAASALALRRRRYETDADVYAQMRLQLLLSAGYVLGCAFRSVFPVYDIKRLCLIDSWLSSVIVGRSVATVAELCFAAQWALLLRGVALATRSSFGVAMSRAVLPLIGAAEVCSWHAVTTTLNFGHVVEESLWGLCALLLVASLVFLWPRCRAQARPVIAAAAVIGLAYATYMFRVDVPMYWSRWLDDSQQGRLAFDVAQGLADASQRWIVSHRWGDWASEVTWMTLYFSVAVWLSIGMVHLPAVWRGEVADGRIQKRSWPAPSLRAMNR